jgi:hypothetical protein
MAVLAEPLAWRDAVFIDYAEIAPAHVRRIVIVGEGKGMVAVEPAVVGVATILRFANGDHDSKSSLVDEDNYGLAGLLAGAVELMASFKLFE